MFNKFKTNIMKPALTNEQKQKFIEEFIKIVQKAPESIRKDFNKDSSITFPIDDNPYIASQVQFRFTPKLKSEFTALMNRLKSRTL